MVKRKNKNLHVVPDPEEVRHDTDEMTDQLVQQIMDEISDEDDQKVMEEQIKEYRKKARRKIAFGVAAAAVAAIAIFLVIYLPTYTTVRVADSYGNVGTQDSYYRSFARGVIKYSRDGVAYLNTRGEERWNASYQIKHPTVVAEEKAAIIYDKNGNSIVVFGEDGMKGEIHTTLPVEKADVSEQGIVSAILKEGTEPRIICYDTAGNILVEHKTSTGGTGYPVKVSLSPDGKVMQVVYLYTKSGQVISKVAYYNFGEAGSEEADRQVAMQEYENTVMADGFFMGQNTSVVVGDNKLCIYKGGAVPKEDQVIKINKDIKSVCHNKKYIALILRNEGKGGYELRIYNASGKQLLAKEFNGDYSHVKVCGSQVIMYDGKACSIYLTNGMQRFEGEMDMSIQEIFPVAGINRYIVMNANGMDNIRLVK